MILSLKIVFYCHLIASLIMVWISIICIRKGSRPAKFYFVAMLCLLSGTIITLLKNANILPQNILTIWGSHWGTTAEILLLSIGLADRINSINSERLLAQREAIDNKQMYIETLEKAEKRISQIFNNAVEGIFQISADNRLVLANPALAEIFGYDSIDEMLTSVTSIQTLFENEDDYRSAFGQFIENQRYIDYEVPMKRKNGELFYATISIQVPTALQIGAETLNYDIFAEGMVLDITDRRRREKAERNLEVAEKANKAKAEFLANVTHELRTPLQAILGYTSLGISRIKSLTKEKTLSYLTEISNSGKRLLSLINDLLDLSRIEDTFRYNFSREHLSIVTTYVIKELDSIRAARDISFKYSPPDFDDLVVMDSEKISHVIRNLVANAIRFANQHDSIDISIENGDSEIQFTIRDRGIGIPEDETTLIFNPFTQSSRNRKTDGGTGLGLSISKKIIDDHQGRIWAENHPEGGAIFRFRIPKSRKQDEKTVEH